MTTNIMVTVYFKDENGDFLDEKTIEEYIDVEYLSLLTKGNYFQFFYTTEEWIIEKVFTKFYIDTLYHRKEYRCEVICFKPIVKFKS